MPHESQPIPPMFHIDVSANNPSDASVVESDGQGDVAGLLLQLLASQQRQVQLLEELIQQSSAAQRQRAAELNQWKQANPVLARNCTQAAEMLSRVQTEFLENLTEEVRCSAENLIDSDFVLNEFVDRFGPRLAHLNGVLQVLSQLSNASNPPSASS